MKLSQTKKEALVRDTLARLSDQWTLFTIDALEDEGEIRFSQLQRRLKGVSQKMLTKTLRQLERDGLVSRRVHPTVPPRVDYKLTPLGESLSESLCGVWEWVGKNIHDVERQRQAYDYAKSGQVRKATGGVRSRPTPTGRPKRPD